MFIVVSFLRSPAALKSIHASMYKIHYIHRFFILVDLNGFAIYARMSVDSNKRHRMGQLNTTKLQQHIVFIFFNEKH